MAGLDEPDTERLLGIHIRTAAGLVAGAKHARETGCTTFQIMSGNPSAWNPGALDPVKAEQFRRFLDEHSLRPCFLHAAYLINLSCRQGRNAGLYEKSLALLKATMRRAAELSCEFVVVHLGSRRGFDRDEALDALAGGLADLPGDDGCMLLLENGAGAGDSVGSGFEELADVLKAAAERRVKQPLGICLDTAHLWGAGYDLQSAAAAERLVDEFDELVGIDRLHLIHINDSSVERGSRRDRHEHPGKGLIPWEALEAIVRHPKLRQMAMILETPGKSSPSDKQRMRDLRALAGR